MLSILSGRQRRLRDRMLSSLSGMGIDIAPVTVTRRVTYWDASLIGLSVAEFQPKSAAAQEMTNLWKWIAKQIKYDDSHRQEPVELEEILHV